MCKCTPESRTPFCGKPGCEKPEQDVARNHLAADEIKRMVQNRVSFSLNEISEETLRDAGCWERVFVLPEPFNERVSYLGGALVQMTTRKPEDDKLRSVVGKLCQSLSYILNSASWREGELHDFDLDELQRKLRRFL